LEKWATKLNCSKADKDAAKVLKAARLTWYDMQFCDVQRWWSGW
jgi:hypothetical protein